MSEPSDTTGRLSLKKILEKAEKKAKKGEGRLPKYLAPVAADRAARRQFSFSRLKGTLHEHSADKIVGMEEMESLFGTVARSVGCGNVGSCGAGRDRLCKSGRFCRDYPPPALLHLAQTKFEVDKAIDMIGRFLALPRAAQIAART